MRNLTNLNDQLVNEIADKHVADIIDSLNEDQEVEDLFDEVAESDDDSRELDYAVRQVVLARMIAKLAVRV